MILPCGRTLVWSLKQSQTGVTDARTTRIPFAVASSVIDVMLSPTVPSVPGPSTPVKSLVPPRMTTARGFKAITSCLNRTSI